MLSRSGMNRIVAVLVALLMASSWEIIVHQHQIRKLNIELEKERNRYSDLKLEYNRLELTNSKEAATDHIDYIVQEKELAELAKKNAGKKPAVASVPVPPGAVASPNASAKPEDLAKVDSTKKEETKPVAVKEEAKPAVAKAEEKKEVKALEVAKVEPKKSVEPAKTEVKKTVEVKVEAPKVEIKKATEIAKVEEKKSFIPGGDKLDELIKSYK